MEDKQINFQEIIDALDTEVLDKDLIQDNKLAFMFEKQLYRVRMPKQKELMQAKEIYHSTKIKLLQKGDVLTEDQLRETLKKNNINVSELESELRNLDNELIQASLSLAHKKDNETDGILKAKEKITTIKNKRYKIAENIAENLSSSLQNQAKDKQYEYLTFACTEKYTVKDDKGIWDRVWDKLEDYENVDTNLTYIALGYLTRLVLTT